MMHSWPIFQPQDSAAELASHPHRVTLLEGSAGLGFPPLCAYCGQAAFANILVQKVFRQTSWGDSVTTFVTQQAEVPFCDRCIAQHHSEQRLLTWPQRVWVSLATGLTVSAVGCGFLALMFLPVALKDVGRPGFPFPLVVVAFFVLIATSSFTGAWKQNAHRRVAPQTSITLAFDFSERCAPWLETARCTYSIRNAAFARAFTQINQHLVLH